MSILGESSRGNPEFRGECAKEEVEGWEKLSKGIRRHSKATELAGVAKTNCSDTI
jgi:hypothetical protein